MKRHFKLLELFFELVTIVCSFVVEKADDDSDEWFDIYLETRAGTFQAEVYDDLGPKSAHFAQRAATNNHFAAQFSDVHGV